MTERQVRLILDFRPDVIMCTPSYMLTILDELERQGVDPRSTGLRVGIFGAEPWTEDMRRELELRLDLHAVDIYGLSEVIGPGVSQECVETKDGLHVWEDHFYPEIIDPTTCDVLPDGAPGELVFTSLTKEAMPIIRYRTRDLSGLLPGTARTKRRMTKVTGRTDDLVILRGVNVFPSQIEEQILRVDGLAPHYQCVLDRPGRLDTLTIRVESRSATDDAGRRGLAESLTRLVKQNVGVSVDVDVLRPDALERSTGKAQRLVDSGTSADERGRRPAGTFASGLVTRTRPQPRCTQAADCGRRCSAGLRRLRPRSTPRSARTVVVRGGDGEDSCRAPAPPTGSNAYPHRGVEVSKPHIGWGHHHPGDTPPPRP